MDFVAIDFETASGNASSACQLGVVFVENSRIAHQDCWLIKPPRLYFSPRNVAIHGIRAEDVRHAPTMKDIWQQLCPRLDGRVLIAHNARFDMAVLNSSLAAHGIPCPRLEFTCTRVLARGAWPGRSRYGLKPLGSWLGIDFQHHDALEDASCCAQIALAAARSAKSSTLADLESKLRVSRGKCDGGRIVSPRLIGRRADSGGTPRKSTDRWGFPSVGRAYKPAGVDPQTILSASDRSLPLAGKKIVLLGPLRGLDPSQSMELITKLGGECQAAVDQQTSYVIACGTTLEAAAQVVCDAVADWDDNVGSTEVGIRVLSERQFRALLPGGKATAWN